MERRSLSFLEFFAGAGMARAGLGPQWNCLFANDFDFKKCLTYQDNWGAPGVLRVGDIKTVSANEIPGFADLAWASFPCQDLSLAGAGAGLKGERSGTFYPFWDVLASLIADERGPRIVALENVTGALTSHNGRDFEAICRKFHENGYRCGAIVVDAELFLPQSRPRLFVIGVLKGVSIPHQLMTPFALHPFHSKGLQTAHSKLDDELKRNWVWWNLPVPGHRKSVFADIIEDHPTGVVWHSPRETLNLLGMMSEINLAKVEQAKRAGRRMIGGVYKRTRRLADGSKVQRAEIRFDDIAGCLRTPAGGSSRQLIMVVEGNTVRSRLISPRETARLMGLPDSYRLPRNYNEAYHLTGDGVAVPVVAYLSKHIFEPLLLSSEQERADFEISRRTALGV